MVPERSDITIIGGGSAGLALAFHLAEQECDHLSITILEARQKYLNDRTWCFWDFSELHEKLQPIVRKRWQHWSFSSGTETVAHHSTAHPYCAVSAGDYYQRVVGRIGGLANFSLVQGCGANDIIKEDTGYLITTSDGDMWSRYVIDTRPPIYDYLHTIAPSKEPKLSELFSGTLLYQIFFGVEVELDHDFFDDSLVLLMADLHEEYNGLAFKYVLPYSPKRALIEYTTFTPHFFPAEQLKSNCLHALEQLLGSGNHRLVYEEGAILPMGYSGVKSTQDNLLYAGIVGGSVRDSTGYAFIRTQRWAARCAADLVKGKLSQTMACDTRLDHFMDSTFLKVLRRNPQLSPKLFMNLARSLSADAFARFMMEKSTWRDYLKVISSMPKKPFIQEISSASN